MSAPPEKKDKTKKNLHAIYLNSIAASMMKNCKPYCKEFKKPRDNLAQRIAGEIAAHYILSHYMESASKTLDIESENYIRPRHEIQWAARRLGLDINSPVIPQIINSVRPGKHAPSDNDPIVVPTPKKDRSRYIPGPNSIESESANIKITSKHTEQPNAFKSPSASSKNGHHHHRHHSNKDIPHSPHSHHRSRRPIQIIDDNNYTPRQRRAPRIDDPTMDIETTWGPEDSHGGRRGGSRVEPDRSGSFVDRIGRLLAGDPEYVASSFGEGFVVPQPSLVDEKDVSVRSAREFVPRERRSRAPNAAVIASAAVDLAPTLDPLGIPTKTATNTNTNTNTKDSNASSVAKKKSRTSTRTATKTNTEEGVKEETKTKTEDEEKTESEAKSETKTKTEESEEAKTETKSESESESETKTKTKTESDDSKSYSSDYEEEEEEEEEEDYYSESYSN